MDAGILMPAQIVLNIILLRIALLVNLEKQVKVCGVPEKIFLVQ